MLTPWKAKRIMHGFHAAVCLLCDGDDFIFCQQCFIPWSANWIECMNVESMSPRQKLRLDNAEQFLCFTCIYDCEYELDIVNGLTDDQEAQLAKVKEYMINIGGVPPVGLASVRLL